MVLFSFFHVSSRRLLKGHIGILVSCCLWDIVLLSKSNIGKARDENSLGNALLLFFVLQSSVGFGQLISSSYCVSDIACYFPLRIDYLFIKRSKVTQDSPPLFSHISPECPGAQMWHAVLCHSLKWHSPYRPSWVLFICRCEKSQVLLPGYAFCIDRILMTLKTSL